MRFCLAALLLLLAQPVRAETQLGNLTGSYYFSEESCGADGKSAECKMTIEFTGKAARDLFNRMKVKAIKDECTGGTRKSDANGLTCYKVKSEYSCDFGYSFAKQKMTSSDVSC
jgi:hypothetical protein